MTKQEIIIEIQNAFSETQYPGDKNITSSPYKAQYPDYEGNQIDKVFKGKSWNEVSENDLAFQNSAMAFFTNDAWRYYLPAYMILIVNDIKKADVIADDLVRYLTVPEEKVGITQEETFKDFERFTERVAEFSLEQGRAILHFLEYLFENHKDHYPDNEPLKPIDQYWFKFKNK